MVIRNKLTSEEKTEIRKSFPFTFSPEDEERMNAHFEPRLIIGRSTRGKRVFLRCTACGNDAVWEARHSAPKHNSEASCPFCRQSVRVIHASKYSRSTSLNEEYHAAWLRPAPDGGLLIEAGWVSRNWYIDWVTQGEIPGEDVDECKFLSYEAYFKRKERYYLAPGKAWMIGRDTVREPFAVNCMGNTGYDGSYALFGVESLKETSMRYCQLQEWYFDQTANDIGEADIEVKNVIKYLAHYSQYPSMELAVRIGFSGAVWDLMGGCKNHRQLNWAATTPADFLRLDRQNAKLFLNRELSFTDLRSLHYLKLPVPKYCSLRLQIGSEENIESVAQCAKTAGVSLERAVNYVLSNPPQCSRAGVSKKDVIQYWKDYLSMAEQLKYDLSREDVTMPHDLEERHNAAAAIIRIQADAEERKKYEKRYKKLCKRYEFSYGGLKIVVPKSASEIVTEGKVLQHCVGGYAARHINGSLDILFLRHERKPGKPFLTIEMRESSEMNKKPFLQQIHGYKNESYAGNGARRMAVRPEQKYAWFLDVWQAWLAAGSPRDKEGKPRFTADPPQNNKEVKTA